MSGAVTGRPALCLNMIVRNEAHIVGEVLDSVAPYISSWVIVDTGSDDGTQDLIKSHMAGLDIPGELYERPWRDFGHNRSEALTLAQGHGDYIWVIDADDLLVGTPDFTRLSADIYWLRYLVHSREFQWRPQLFRDGLAVHYEGVLHECPVCDDPYVERRIEGEYQIEYRCLGARSLDPHRLERDCDLLLAEVERNPEHVHSVNHLAGAYFARSDFVNARKWYERRVEIGGFAEDVYLALWRIAESMSGLESPWHDVQDTLLTAWEVRPTRAETVYAIARHYREEQRYLLGYQFAKLAADVPFPEQDVLFVRPDIYRWRATEEKAICGSFIGKHAEAFTLFRRLLAGSDLPDDERQRIAVNRDVLVPTMIAAASPYPDPALLPGPRPGRDGADVVVSLVAGPDRGGTEQTVNSFLNCCTDAARVGRFLVVDAGLSAEDRAILQERYGFLEFADPAPTDGPGAQLAQICAQIDARFWLHLGQGWRFFAPENLISRLAAVLEAEPQVFQVAVNFSDAVTPIRTCAAEEVVRRAPDAGRYVLTDALASGPAMFDTARLDRAGDVADTDADPIAELGRRAIAAGLRTASLDEVLCVAAI